jgi:hypothetical protein
MAGRISGGLWGPAISAFTDFGSKCELMELS